MKRSATACTTVGLVLVSKRTIRGPKSFEEMKEESKTDTASRKLPEARIETHKTRPARGDETNDVNKGNLCLSTYG